MNIKVIIFDLGKVLFDYDLNLISNAFIPYAQKKEDLKNINRFMMQNDEIFSKYEKGKISSKDFYSELSEIVGLKVDYEKFCNLWNNIFTPIEDMIAFVPKLTKKYRLALLSNTNELHYEFLERLYPELFKNFNDFFLSYRMRLRKPEKEIYKQVIDYYELKANELFFTDDLDINVISAKKTGINAFVFKNLEKLKKDLSMHGVKV